MSKLVAQFNKVSGPNVIGEYTISFSIQKEHLQPLLDAVSQLTRKSHVILNILPLNNASEANPVLNESAQEKKNRYNKKIHACFDEIAKMWKAPSDSVKKSIKDKLKKDGTIKESLAELNVDQQLEVINRLENIITPTHE